jgi:hypothetical protein
MGTGFEQGPVFHRQGSLIDPDHLSVCAEQITPYPPGIPVIIPGEPITADGQGRRGWSRPQEHADRAVS